MIRVLHLMGTMNCGGSQNMIMNIYREIDREKVQFDFLINVEGKCFFTDEIEKLGGRIFYIPRWNVKSTFSYIKMLDAFLSEHPEINILHGHVSSSSLFNLYLAKKHGLVTISHSHNMNTKGMSIKSILAKIGTFPQRFLSDRFYACSLESGQSRFGKRITKSDNFEILKNAIDLERYKKDDTAKEEVMEEYNLRDKFVVGHIGRFYQVKNHIFLIDVFLEILRKKENAVLLLVGSGGEMEKPLRNRVKELGISDKVIFTGVTHKVNALIQNMDCFVFPSFSEGLGIVAIEAQCHGVPCFINNTLSKELYINDNVYGISLGEGAKKWADLILEKYKTKVDEQVAKENIKTAGYHIDLTTKNLEDFYIKIMEEKKK